MMSQRERKRERERDNDCLDQKKYTRKRVRPAGPARSDIITRLCAFPVPPRTCYDIHMTTTTKITHFSTVARPLEPRYFKNASYFGRDRIKRSLSRYRLLERSRGILRFLFWESRFLFGKSNIKKKKEKKRSVQKVMKNSN